MTKEEFDSLKIGDEVISGGMTMKIYGFETVHTEIINDIGKTKHEADFIIDVAQNRRNRLTLSLKETDKLVEYLKNSCNNTELEAKEIRSIVRKEVIDGLKFPDHKSYWGFTLEARDWFIKQVKTLNK